MNTRITFLDVNDNCLRVVRPSDHDLMERWAIDDGQFPTPTECLKQAWNPTRWLTDLYRDRLRAHWEKEATTEVVG